MPSFSSPKFSRKKHSAAFASAAECFYVRNRNRRKKWSTSQSLNRRPDLMLEIVLSQTDHDANDRRFGWLP